jgi:hypothetical protein
LSEGSLRNDIDDPVAPGADWLLDPAGFRQQFTDLDFTAADVLYAKTAEDFVSHDALPRLEAIESKEGGPMPRLLKHASDLGLLMIDIPEFYGGLGLSRTTSMLVSERGALCTLLSVSWGAHPVLAHCPFCTTAPMRRSGPTSQNTQPVSGSPIRECPTTARGRFAGTSTSAP